MHCTIYMHINVYVYKRLHLYRLFLKLLNWTVLIVNNTDANHIVILLFCIKLYSIPTLASASTGVIAGIILGTIFGFLFCIFLPITICLIIGCNTWRNKKRRTRVISVATTTAPVTLPVSEYPVEHYYPAGANFPVGRTSVTINYPVSAHPQLAPHATRVPYNPQVDSSSNVLY